MTERLFVSPRGDGFAWLVLDNATGIVRVRGEGTADELGQAARGVQVPAILVVPAEYVLLTRASIPSRQQRQLLQALPYAVEEQLAADVEDCHFAVGPRAEDGSVSAAVVETTLLAGWLERLDACGVSVEQALIDVLQVPRVQGSTLLVDGDRCLVRTGPTAGFGIDTALVPMAIALLPEDQKSSLAILVHPGERESFELYRTQIESEFPGEVKPGALDYAPFETLCRGIDLNSLNLLQGSFRVAPERTEKKSGWRTVAMLAGFAFALHIMLMIGQGIYLDVQARQYEREARELYNGIFPGEGNVRDIRRRWQAHLGTGGGESSGQFLDLFGQAVKHLPGSDLAIENVNYNEGRGDLVLQLTAKRSEQFVAFAQALGDAGLDAQVGAINQNGDSARGSIRVSGGR